MEILSKLWWKNDSKLSSGISINRGLWIGVDVHKMSSGVSICGGLWTSVEVEMPIFGGDEFTMRRRS